MLTSISSFARLSATTGICRKSIPSMGRSPEVDQNKYEKAVHFCTVAQIITPEEKEKWFDGKNHMPVAAEEVAEFTGIPVYQVEKNEFAFKAREPEDYVRASLVRLALCDLVNDIISGLDPEEALDVGSGRWRTLRATLISVWKTVLSHRNRDFPSICRSSRKSNWICRLSPVSQVWMWKC